MHKNFAEWYRLVSIEPNGDVLKNRWAGVEEWSTFLRNNDDAVLETVRIFQGLPKVTSREPFLEVFWKHDPAFRQRDNELEQRVLAGASLIQAVTQDGDDDVDLRTAMLVGTAIGTSCLRTTDSHLEELIGAVLAGLHNVATLQRRRRGFDSKLLTGAEEDALMKTIETDVPDNQLRRSLAKAFEIIMVAVRRSENALADAAHDLRCADEETNILWWLEGGCSRDLNKSWSMLQNEAPITAGWELADLTDVALGPREVTAFLNRVVLSTKETSKEQPLYNYVNAISDSWAKARTANLPEQALDLAPLSLALMLRAKSGVLNWQQYFETTGGMSPSKPLAPELAAKQAYLEAVLLRTLVVTKD